MDSARLLDRAVARTRLCFEPLDLRRWLRLAAISWLAWLGSVGATLQTRFPSPGTLGDLMPDHVEMPLLLTLLSVSVGMGFALWLLLTWLRSRGQVMLLQLVARGDGKTRALWDSAAPLASDLFRVRALVDLAAFLLLGLAGGAGAGASFWFRPDDPLAFGGGVPLLASGVFGLLLTLAWTLAIFLLDDLVLPLAWSQGSTLRQGAGQLRALWAQKLPSLLGYLVLRGVASLCVAMLTLGLSCLTCGLLWWLPFVLALLIAPLRIFLQTLPLAFLYEIDPERYRVYAPLPEVRRT